MKIGCRCGAAIPDISDFQENKAYFVPDQLFEQMRVELQDGGCPWGVTRAYVRHMYQCYSCGRLYVENQDGGFDSFKPDENLKFGILKGD